MTPQEEATARVLIQAVMHRYASLGRENCDFEEAAKCFEPNAIYRIPDGRELPPSQMSEVVRGKEASWIRHHITTIDISFVSDSEAHAESYFFASTNYKFTDHWGRWKDVFCLQPDGRWLIRERTIIVEGQDPEGWTAIVYGGEALKNA